MTYVLNTYMIYVLNTHYYLSSGMYLYTEEEYGRYLKYIKETGKHVYTVQIHFYVKYNCMCMFLHAQGRS